MEKVGKGGTGRAVPKELQLAKKLFCLCLLGRRCCLHLYLHLPCSPSSFCQVTLGRASRLMHSRCGHGPSPTPGLLRGGREGVGLSLCIS